MTAMLIRYLLVLLGSSALLALSIIASAGFPLVAG
jgi:hypothetical protein